MKCIQEAPLLPSYAFDQIIFPKMIRELYGLLGKKTQGNIWYIATFSFPIFQYSSVKHKENFMLHQITLHRLYFVHPINFYERRPKGLRKF